MTARSFQAGLLVEKDSFYVAREADEVLFGRLSRMEFSAVLAPRQVGKSSLCVRVIDRLAAKGFRVVTIEDATVGTASVEAAEQELKWYYGLGSRIAEDLGLEQAFRARWREDPERVPLERFRAFLERDVCAGEARTVVFLDEIDRVRSVSVNFDGFCELLRAIANAKGHEAWWGRITFCLAGVATPDELLRDETRVALAIPGLLVRVDDLTREQMDEFAPGLASLPGGAGPWLDAIFAWTQGHPVLTQTLGKALVDDAPAGADAEAEVEARVKALFLARGRTGHPVFLDTDRRFGASVERATDPRLLRLLHLYRQLQEREEIAADENDPLQLALRVGGLAALRNGALVRRNRIFATLFDAAWVEERKGARPFVEQIDSWSRTRESNLLLTGERLLRAEEWARTRNDLTQAEKDYLAAAREREIRLAEERGRAEAERAREGERAREREAREKERAEHEETKKKQWRVIALSVGIGAVGFAAAFVLTYRARNEAQAAERLAQQQRNVAQQREREARALQFSVRASGLQLQAQSPGFEYEELADALILRRDVSLRPDVAAPGVGEALFQAASAVLDRMPLQGHSAGVSRVAFSPDGARVVTASYDRTACVWDAASGRLLATLRGHEQDVVDASFSPDGGRVVTASDDGTARVWEVASGRQLALLRGHEDRVARAAFSPDGGRVVTASSDATARVWGASDGHMITTLRGHAGRVWRASFSPDGARVLTASGDHTAGIWDAADGHALAVFRGHEGEVVDASFSLDGARVATASLDKTARVWEASSGRPLATLSGHTSGVVGVAFSSRGDAVVTASSDRTARVWRAQDGALLVMLPGHTERLTGASFSPDAAHRHVLTSSRDGTARVWDTHSGRLTATFAGHIDSVVQAAFGPDGMRVATASEDGTAQLWGGGDGRLLTAMAPAEDALVDASLNGARVAAALKDGRAFVWSATDGRLLAVLQGHRSALAAVSFSPDGTLILTASDDATARVWNANVASPGDTPAERNQPDHRLLLALSGHRSELIAASFSPDGARILTASWDGTARLWGASDGRLIAPLQHAAGTDVVPLMGASFSPTSDRVVTSSSDMSARVWGAADGHPLATLRGHEGPLNGAWFSADGRRVVTASDDATARIWDAVSGHEIATLRGHGGPVLVAAFSPDGARVVTASSDNTARVWDAASGRELAALRGHTAAVVGASFSSDGVRVVTASRDRTARVWGARDGRPLAVLSRHTAPVVRALFVDDVRVLTAGGDGAAYLWNLDPAVAHAVGCALVCDKPVWRDPTPTDNPRASRADALHAACADVPGTPGAPR